MTTEATIDEGVAADTLPAADTAPAADAVPAADTAQAGPEAPIEYSFKAPDGVKLDPERVAEFTTLAQELKLPPEKAQALVDMAARIEVKRAADHVAQVKAWGDEVRADKELGGDKLPAALAVAQKAIDLGPPELRDLLDLTGLGNHPAVFRWAHAVGKALSEDTFRGGNPPAPAASMADRLYGKA